MWRAACRKVGIFSALVAPAFVLGACASAGGGCPPLVAYPAAAQLRAARELQALSRDSEIGAMIVDYGKMRDACRASAR